MVQFFMAVLEALRVFFRARGDTALEVLALRQQVAVLKRQRPRPPLNSSDRFFWTTLRRFWSLDRGLPDCPTGDRRRLASRRLSPVLALAVSSTRRHANHREGIDAFDFFTVPTATFRVLYCFFVIEHQRRKILHCNVTPHPTAEWIIQQLREAFPESGRYRYVLFDRDRKFNAEVISFLKAAGLEPKRTSVQAPWQNGLAERWIGSCRREILDQIIALNKQHLRRVPQDYVNYYEQDRLHDSLQKDAPNRRAVQQRPGPHATVISLPRLGGLHHRYTWSQAA